MEPGLYVTFFTVGEPPADQLPAIGPFDYLVVRAGGLVADRRAVSQVGDVGGLRWIEAELELQRAFGHERGGVRRPDLRIAAREGVYLRFSSLDGGAGEDPVPEIGPYAAIVVTRQVVEGDGEAIAGRSSISDRAWVLRGGGPALLGIIRPDIAFRTRTSNYHPRIHQARPVAPPSAAAAGTAAPGPPAAALVPPEPAIRPPSAPLGRPPDFPASGPVDAPVFRPPAPPIVTPRAQTPTPPAPAPSPQRAASDDSVSIDDASPLRARLGGALRADGMAETVISPQELSRRGARRWATIVLVGAMIIGLGAFGAFALRSALSPSAPGISVVGISKAVRGTQFDYTVATASRTTSVGAARAQGTYLIVFVTLTYRGADRGTLSPSAFRLVDGGGAQYPALSESDPAYQNANSNPGSPLVWMTSYPVGQAVSTPVIFDVDATLRGVQLMILEVPTVRVRLD